MPFLTTCPQCHKPCRVGDDMAGHRVRCPSCQAAFVAQPDPAQAPAPPVAPAPRPLPAPPPSTWARTDPRAAARERTALPGLGLIVNGILTSGMYLFMLVFVLIGALSLIEEPKLVKRWNQELESRTDRPDIRIEFQDGFTIGVIVQLVLLAIGLGIGLSILMAGLQLRRLRNYRNVFLCSVISLLPCTTCFWGLPFGVWALLVLRDPAVKPAFES
jgi:hypothetical protein